MSNPHHGSARPRRPQLVRLPVAPDPSREVELAELMERIARLRGRARMIAQTHPRLDAATLGGRYVAEHLLCVERRYTLACRHGDVSFLRLAQLRYDSSGLLGIAHALDPQRLVFLDTEASGLSGNEATLAFMVGVCKLEGDALLVRQYLLTRPSAEAAMLRHLARELEGATHLVTYNGKRFDVPLLEMRLRRHDAPNVFAGLAHLDLLHAVRRARQLRPDLAPAADCRLQTAEAHLLHLQRVNDLPGHAAPRAWERLLRHHDTSLMRAALDHNRLDVLSLAALLPVLADGTGELLRAPRAGA